MDPRPAVSEKAPEETELGVSPEGDLGIEGRQVDLDEDEDEDEDEDDEEESASDLRREGGFR